MENKYQPRYREYIKERNKCNKEIRRARKTYELKLFEKVKTNPKALYKYVNSNKRLKKHVNKLMTRERTLTKNTQETANVLNKFFKSVFTEENDSIEFIANDFYHQIYGDVQDPFTYTSENCVEQLTNIEVHQDIVIRKFQSSNEFKAPGPDYTSKSP